MLHKGRIHLRRPSCHLHFSLAARRRTIHLVGFGGAARAASGGSGLGLAPAKLMLFGGSGHKMYLGCLNCSQYATDSILNKYGSNGSAYSATSIWNHYSEFGSAYSTYSPCNSYATDPL